VGSSAAPRSKLLVLERQRHELENRLRLAEIDPMALAPRLIDCWRAMIDNMENLTRSPHAPIEHIEEARERLANRLDVQLIPDQG
jgi:hypothetical protein